MLGNYNVKEYITPILLLISRHSILQWRCVVLLFSTLGTISSFRNCVDEIFHCMDE